MDVSMPDMTGFDATRRIREFDQTLKVLILTMHEEEELVARCLEAGASGTRLLVSGTILSRQCQPVGGALLDFWQADDRGNYGNTGFRYRGHQFTDENGGYQLETVVPGLYPGRTRHIHVKVQAPNGPILTTQLYFPDEPRNRTDGIFNSALVMAVQDADDGKNARFDFVVS